MADIDPLFSYLKDQGGSDLHLVAGMQPRIRRKGELEDIADWPVLDDARLSGMLKEIADDEDWQSFTDTNELDFAYGLSGVGRFRANYFQRQGGCGAVFRIIPTEILSLEDLNAPPAITKMAMTPRGLLLVTGPTGSGKSTTLAAMINHINTHECRHIITIEDPVEFVHPNKKSVFCQREVGKDTESFAAALRGAIRQDPDVIVVGEMRDIETISLAMTAAEMGILVLATLHTNSAIKAIDRLVDAFPAEQQEQARLALSECLAGVVAQLLLPTADGKGRCAVHEILMRVPSMPNILRTGNVKMLASVMQSGKKLGMQSMDDGLQKLLQEGKITPMTAYLKAKNKALFESMLPK